MISQPHTQSKSFNQSRNRIEKNNDKQHNID